MPSTKPRAIAAGIGPIRLIEDQDPAAQDTRPVERDRQRELRLFTVHPATPERVANRSLDLDFAPDGMGGFMLTRNMDPAAQLELQRFLFEVTRKVGKSVSTVPNDGTPEAAARRMEAFRETLRSFGRRRGTTALHAAGSLFLEHGEKARTELLRTWRPDWSATLAKIDAHLERAGVPVADVQPKLWEST